MAPARSVTAGELLYWMADNMSIWVKPTVMALSYFLIGMGHLIAIGIDIGER